MLFRFFLCLRNKWSIYWWANDGDWTRAWWIHNPLPWSTWLHPPLPPHRFKSLSTIRSFWTPLWPLSKISFFLYYRKKVYWLLCFGIRGNKASTYEYAWQSFKQRGWAVHFIDLTSLYLRLKIGAGRAVKGSFSRQRASSKHLLLSKWKAANGTWRSEPLSEKAIAR